MLRRAFLQTVAAVSMQPNIESDDTDRHRLPATRKSRRWVQTRLDEHIGLDSFYHWRFQNDSYMLPETASQARTQAKVLTQLIDAPYRHQEYDCNGMSIQLLSYFLRTGIDAGIISNGNHMWVIMVVADGSVVEWEPIWNRDVTAKTTGDYRTNEGFICF